MLQGLLRPQHLLIILVIGLFIFGPRRLPEMGSGIGKAIRGFKKAVSGEEKEIPEDKQKT